MPGTEERRIKFAVREERYCQCADCLAIETLDFINGGLEKHSHWKQEGDKIIHIPCKENNEYSS